MLRVLLAAAAGGLLCLAFPTFDVWAAAPVAIGLLSVALVGVRGRVGFGLGTLAGLVFFVPTLSWSGVYVGALPWIALATLEALYVGLFGALVALLGRGRSVRPLVVAVAWTVTESLRGISPYGGFPWVKVAFSQADSPFGRLAALGGAPLVAFAVALVGGLLALGAVTVLPRVTAWLGAPALARTSTSAADAGASATPRPRLRAGAILAGALAVAVAGLLVPLPVAAEGNGSANVVGVQGNVPRPGLDFNAERRAVLDNHVAATEQVVEQVDAGQAPKPDLVVWPENASDIDPLRNADARALIEDTVEALDTPLVVGGLLADPDGVRNVSILFEPGRGPVDQYVKRHPVPFGEYIPNREFFRLFSDKVDLVRRDFLPGEGPGVFHVPTESGTIRAGLAICFEVAYDDVVRDVVTQGANLLVIQTNNATFGYTAESPQQLAISRLRAIEHGRSVLHVSTVGQSALITPDGTAHDVTTLFTQAVISGALPLRDTQTLATRIGPTPDWAAAVVLVFLIGEAVIRRRSRSEPLAHPEEKDDDDDDDA